MKKGRIIIITGTPGTGKTTIAHMIAEKSSFSKSVHLHTDDFYHYLCKGAIPPYLPESENQNLVVIEAFLETAKRFSRAGYDVIVDGIVGPWFLKPWIKASIDYDIYYVVLRAAKEETLKRATERGKLTKKENIDLVKIMWDQFNNLGNYESYVIDTTKYSVEETVLVVMEKIKNKSHLLI